MKEFDVIDRLETQITDENNETFRRETVSHEFRTSQSAKSGDNFRKYKVIRNCWPKVRGCAMNLVEHPHGGGNHQHVNHASSVAACLLPRK